MIPAAVITVVIETSLFFLYGYRQKMFLLIVALSNLLTNLSLNLAVFVTALLCARQNVPIFVLYMVIAAGEAGAVAVEYLIYKKYLQRTDGNRLLFFQVLSTNAVSFSAGILLGFFLG